MSRLITLSIALFVAMVGLSLVSSEASACRLFHWGGHHGCHGCAPAASDCGGCNNGCGHHGGGCGHHGGCGGHHGCGGCASDCGGAQGGTVIQEAPKGEGDVPEAPPAAEPKAAEPKETGIRSNRFFRTASFRR
jgi:hypothetical protein